MPGIGKQKKKSGAFGFLKKLIKRKETKIESGGGSGKQ
jgi:hypothetical protein